MKPTRLIILFFGAIALFVLAFIFFLNSQSRKQDTDALRDLTLPPETVSEYQTYEPEPEYDPTDITQTPPGVTPFVVSSVCAFNWGAHLRQYCNAGDSATLDIVEGTTQAEVMRDLTMCLNEMMQRMDVYDDPNLRYIDSEVALNEANRKALACELTGRYGDSPIFDKGSIGYMIKEHVESGTISRLEKK